MRQRLNLFAETARQRERAQHGSEGLTNRFQSARRKERSIVVGVQLNSSNSMTFRRSAQLASHQLLLTLRFFVSLQDPRDTR